VVRHGGPADRAEVDGVEVAQRVQAVLGHHDTVLGVVVRAPWELFPGERDAAVQRDRVEDSPTRGDDLAANPVGGNGGDTELLRGTHAYSGFVGDYVE
jgi:hypothetical protein